jgi:hypothetical protein
MKTALPSISSIVLPFLAVGFAAAGEPNANAFTPDIPKTWDEQALAALEVPLPDPKFSPVAVPSEYYHRIPVRPIYKSYPVYAPGKEPAGYLDRLKQEKPVILWDDKGTRPPLRSEADWIAAGEMVFDAAIFYDAVARAEDVRNPEWHRKVAPLLTPEGVFPFARYIVREKGKVELGNNACAFCHSRVLSDGSVVKGAQGNFAFDKAVAWSSQRSTPEEVRADYRGLSGAPWLKDHDPAAGIEHKSMEELLAMFDAIPPGVLTRHHASPASPPVIPDLIGVKDRRYLDRTGRARHRGIGDLMRYAALNNEVDFRSRFGDFIPVGKDFRELPEPADTNFPGGDRYSDEQLYALTLYVYSLKPPPNPNLPQTPAQKALVQRGREVFDREDCYRCHKPESGYTNNKLIPAPGFKVPQNHPDAANIMSRSIGSDPTLTLWTRRGTGFYKVPSLLGVWYRGPFEHNGSCATLEDWFDPRRLRDDYVPTGWKGPPGTKTRAVKGHEFGLDLSDEDKKALIAFLKTL